VPNFALADNRIRKQISATEVARILRDMRSAYSPWTISAVARILRGTLALAVRRGILTRSPMDGLAPSELPRQRNAKKVAVVDAETIARLAIALSASLGSRRPTKYACRQPSLVPLPYRGDSRTSDPRGGRGPSVAQRSPH
jgi:hypothetical protein